MERVWRTSGAFHRPVYGADFRHERPREWPELFDFVHPNDAASVDLCSSSRSQVLRDGVAVSGRAKLSALLTVHKLVRECNRAKCTRMCNVHVHLPHV